MHLNFSKMHCRVGIYDDPLIQDHLHKKACFARHFDLHRNPPSTVPPVRRRVRIACLDGSFDLCQSALLLTERLAVSALVHSGVCLVGAHQDAVQRAEILGVAVVCAGLNGTFDTLIGLAVHFVPLLIFEFAIIMARERETMQMGFFHNFS